MIKNKSGFAVLETLLILIIIAIIGGTGWYVMTSKSKTNETFSNSAAISSQAPSVGYSDYVSVMQKDGTDLWQAPHDATKNTDQQAILTTLFKTKCKSQGNVAISYTTFSNNELFKQDGNYAYINAGCNNRTHDPNKQEGGGAMFFLHKDKNGSWTVDGLTQDEGPTCSAVDSKGYPTTIVAKCFDESGNLRATKI